MTECRYKFEGAPFFYPCQHFTVQIQISAFRFLKRFECITLRTTCIEVTIILCQVRLLTFRPPQAHRHTEWEPSMCEMVSVAIYRENRSRQVRLSWAQNGSGYPRRTKQLFTSETRGEDGSPSASILMREVQLPVVSDIKTTWNDGTFGMITASLN